MFKKLVESFSKIFKKEEEKKQESTAKSQTPNYNTQQPQHQHHTSKKPYQKPYNKYSKPVQVEHAEHGKWNQTQFAVPLVDGKARFHDFQLPGEIMHAIADLGFEYCTPVQTDVLPKALAGYDITAKAQTGTGKTAAFLVSIFSQMIQRPLKYPPPVGTPRVLIVAPTRELVLQIQKDALQLAKYTRFSIVALFGGTQYHKQMDLLARMPVDVIVATPGRLLDFVKQDKVNLSFVEFLVIDEADRMLDMGFIPDMRRILNRVPPRENRQTMFFTATLSDMVIRLSSQWTRERHIVDITPKQMTVLAIEQLVYIITDAEKITLLYNLITKQNLDRVLVFCNRKDEARRVKDKLESHGITCELLSGDVEQNKRIRTLDNFKTGQFRVLVATDVAARGLHVDDISHVVNYNLSRDPEDYVHRIGRTGRAGASGTSISFASENDSHELPNIEEFIGRKLQCIQPPEELLTKLPEPVVAIKPYVEQHRSYNQRRSFQHRRRPDDRRNTRPR